VAQRARRSVFVARARAHDAVYCPPPPDDEGWFLQHPGRRHRLRALHPTDVDRLVERVGAWEHAERLDLMVIIRDFDDSMIAIRLPASGWPVADDEAQLAAVFDALVARHPGLAALQRDIEEEEEQRTRRR
jgi:hypothetical protein